MTPKVAVCTLTADRRLGEHSAAIPHRLDYPNMVYYLNLQTKSLADSKIVWDTQDMYPNNNFIDYWSIDSEWISTPKFDQDQARLVPIIQGRNMARQFAASQNAEWLLFLDSDVVVPPDSIQRLLEIAYDLETEEVVHWIVGGLVPGRGFHGQGPHGTATELLDEILAYTRSVVRAGGVCKQIPGFYASWVFDMEKVFVGGKLVETAKVQHATCGFMMIHRGLYERLGFTAIEHDNFYTDPEGVHAPGLSEDPAFGIYAFKFFGERWTLRLDLVAEHLGDLKNDEVAQF